MLASIEFDYQPVLDAGKVDYVLPHRMLAPEFSAHQGAVAQMVPEGTFGVGHRLAQVAREFRLLILAHFCAPYHLQ